jgi:hypothetical protein
VYVVEVVPETADQITALPSAALPGLLELVDLLMVAPWSGQPYHQSKPDSAMRAHTFGPGDYGMLVALIDDRGRRVIILRVVWLG